MAAVFLVICLDVVKSRPYLSNSTLIFAMFYIVSIGDIVAISAVMGGKTQQYAQIAPIVRYLISVALGLSTAVYAIVFYLLGGPIPQALALLIFTLVAYFQLTRSYPSEHPLNSGNPPAGT